MWAANREKAERRNELNLPRETGFQEFLMDKMTMVLRGQGGSGQERSHFWVVLVSLADNRVESSSPHSCF